MKKIICLATLMILMSCQKKESETTSTQENQNVIELLSTDIFASHIKNENIQLIDVRTKTEFDQGHIKNAKHFHIYSKSFQDSVLTLDKNKPVYLYCKAGSRSEEASLELQKLGFTKIYDLKGGISSWKANGLEIE
jgi:phage shock protein E